MIRGLYTAATGMAIQRDKMDVLTNNLVNAETTGFKADDVITQTFDSVLLNRINDPRSGLVGSYSFGAFSSESVTDFSPGTLEFTGLSTDLALDGNGLFVVETDTGELYTRGGRFSVNSEGYLTNADGCYVLGENGRIAVGDNSFTVSENGDIITDGVIDRLRVVWPDDATSLRKEGNGLYSLAGGTMNDSRGTVRQGFLESSNVNVADEMAEMIAVYRKYEASQKAVIMNDETLGMAVSKLGRL